MCLDNIISERTAHSRWTDLRFVVSMRMFRNVFGPGFIDRSLARRMMTHSINDGLQLDVVYRFLCAQRPRKDRYKAGIFENLIRILCLMNILGIIYIYISLL